MSNKKIEIEVTPEQLEKIEILKSNDIDVGKAVDMLFEFKEFSITQSEEYLDSKISQANKQKEELESQIASIENEINIYNKLKENSLDYEEKQKRLEHEYGENEDTYEMQVQVVKRNISWLHDFFKF